MKLPFVALAALAAALIAAPAQAQEQIVTTQLDSAVVLMAGQGFTPADDAVRGSLDQGEDEEFELELEAGKTYIIMAVCDGDCSDLDLALTSSGQDVDSDYEPDDVPMVMVEVERSATYNLKVEMATCSVEPCAFGVAVFANGGR